MDRRRTVALVGMHALLREGIAQILKDDYEIIDDGEPDVVVLDVSKGPVPGEIVNIKRRHPDAKLVLVNNSIPWKPADVLSIFRIGVAAFLVNPSPLIFLKTIDIVLLDEVVMPREALLDAFRGVPAGVPAGVPTGVQELPTEQGPAPLSPRETEILGLVSKGNPNKVIARLLGLTEATVKVHIKGILRKLRMHNRTQAAIWNSRRIAGLDVLNGERAPAGFPEPFVLPFVPEEPA